MAKPLNSNQIYILILLYIILFCCSSSFVSDAASFSGKINGPSMAAFRQHEEQHELADKGDDDNAFIRQQRQHNLADAALNGGQKDGGDEISVGNKNTEESPRRRLFVAFVFALSFRLPQESDFGTSKDWLSNARLSYDLSRLYAGMGEKYFADRDAVSFMAIFPNTNDTEQSRQCWTANPYGTHLERQLEKFYGTEEARQKADIGADAYEPERHLNSALMDRAEAIITSCSNASWAYPHETVKIVYITNFAEKSFAARNFSALESKIPGIVLPLILLAMNGAAYNYHFYSIPAEHYSEYRDWPVVVHLGIPKIDLIEFPDYLWGGSFCRHVIYIVALSDRLLDRRTDPVNQQFYAVNFAIKEPLERDLNTDLRTAVLLLSPCFWDDFYRMKPDWATCWTQLDTTTGCLMNARQAPIDTYWKLEKHLIGLLMDTAMTMYDRRLGATLRHDRINDTVRPMLQEDRPRLVLVTDLFEEGIAEHLPDERFDLKVYALNLTTFERYKEMERVDFVRLLNPSSPGEIPIKKEGPEPPEWDGHTGMRQSQILLITIGGTISIILALALIGLIALKLYRKDRGKGALRQQQQ